LGQELKLIKRDQHHQELLEKYDFLGFSVRIDKRRTGNLKEWQKAQRVKRRRKCESKSSKGYLRTPTKE
jgi:hypothetical protein